MSGSSTLGVDEAVQQLRRSLPDQETIREAVGQVRGRMFNVSARCEAVEQLRQSLKEHETLRKHVERTSVRLFEQRQRVVAEVIEPVEEYVNGLANTPKEFDKSVRAFRIEINRFDSAVQCIKTEAAKSALAWLGGGGMAAGHALLALAGPAGWTVGGLALVGSGTYLHYRNGVLAQKAVQERVRVEREIRSLRTARRKIEGFEASTRTYTEGTLASLGWLCDYAPHDYRQFDPGQKERLAALINHIRALSELIRKEVAL